jgi:diguanylate cyclase (GGDEF)-like protein
MIGVAFSYRSGKSQVMFRAGTVRRGAASVVTSFPDGWQVRTFGSVDPASVGANSAALALFLAGTALSSSLALLLVVLATSRSRALHLVDQKTGELRHQALHDALTGLPNRDLIADRAQQLLAHNQRHDVTTAALYLDIDEFKNVNDSLGHETGDRLLQAVAGRLRSVLRSGDTVGRLGGDEFVVLLDGGDLDLAAEHVAQLIVEVVRKPFVLDGVPMPVAVTISVGVAVGNVGTVDQLFRDADLALYQAKAAGKNCFAVFSAELDATALRRSRLEFELRGALQAEQFRLVYQPIYDLTDLSVVGVEALLRWRHPDLGDVGPDEFVPLLEASGQITEVGRYVLREACAQVAAWRQAKPSLGLSVNVSGRQLDRDGIVDEVAHALRRSGLEPGALTIEITETALMRNVGSTAQRLVELKALGVALAIDDFGTGYSSLAYIQSFPIDCLKIDRGFTASVATSPEADVLVHSLVQLGDNLKLATVAEGIETVQQLDFLRREGVGLGQGFLFAAPVAPAVLEAEFFCPEGDFAGRQ